jgi:hypothetical protein
VTSKTELWRAAAHALVIALGIALGLSAEAFFTRSREQARQPEAPANQVSSPVSLAPTPPRLDVKEALELDRRLSALEARTHTLDAAASTSTPATPLPSPEEAARANSEAREALMARFEREGTDSRWAPAATASLQADLRATRAVENGAIVKDVRCGTTICVAKLEWPDYAAARKNYASLAEAYYALNCARSIHIPAPNDPTRAYEAKLVLDCEALRATSQ